MPNQGLVQQGGGAFNPGQFGQQGFSQGPGGSFSPAGIQSQGGVQQFQGQIPGNGLVNGGQQFAPVQNFLPGSGFQGQPQQIPQQFLQQGGAQSFSPQGAQGFNAQGVQQGGSISSPGFPFDYAGPYTNIPGGSPFGGQFAGVQPGSGGPQGQTVLALNNGQQRTVTTAASTHGESASAEQAVSKPAETKSG